MNLIQESYQVFVAYSRHLFLLIPPNYQLLVMQTIYRTGRILKHVMLQHGY